MLFEALAPRMLRVARGVLGPNDPDVDDAAQEALVAFLRALPAFRGECSVAHYATRIAVRCCMVLRKRDRRGREIAEQAADADASDDMVLAGEPVVAARRRSEIRELVGTLPEAQAETLALRIVMGLSMDEVAASTGVPLNTVRSRLRLAKEALRKRIESDPALAELLEVGS
jgi:RNA polymerase sigma-70 factor (ECF subfamily)